MKTPEILRGPLSKRTLRLAETLESSILEMVDEIANREAVIVGGGKVPAETVAGIQTALFTAAGKFSGVCIGQVVDTHENKVALIDEQLAHLRGCMIDEALSNVEDVGQG